MLQKRKFPELSTQTFTDPKKRIHEVVTLQHQVSSGFPRAPGHLSKTPTSKTTRPKEDRLLDRGFYCCWGSRCLQYKAMVIFGVLRNRLNRYSRLRKERCSGSSVGLTWPHHVPKAKGLGHSIWQPSCRLTGTETQQTWVKSLSRKQLEMLQVTWMLLKHNSISKLFLK